MRSRNFVYFRPRKQFLRIVAEVSAGEEWVARLEEAGLDASVNRDEKLRVNVAPKDFEPKRALITELLHRAVEEHQQE